MNPGTRYVVEDKSVFFCIASDEDTLDHLRRGVGRKWLIAYEQNILVAHTKDEKVKVQRASKMFRPAIMDLDESRGKYTITQSAKQFFEKYDVDGDAQLDISELQDAFQKLGLMLSDKEVTDIINEHDHDCDGSINLAEFQALVQSAWLHGWIAMAQPGKLSDGQDFSSTGQGFNILNLGLENNKSEEQMLKEVVHQVSKENKLSKKI